jgi:hypothetical protein
VTKLLADVDTLLLISCQNPRHQFGGNMMHAQFSSQNLLACPITIPISARSWMVWRWSSQTSCWSLATVSHVVQLMDIWPVLNRACHSITRVRLMFSSPNACLILWQGLRCTFSDICTNRDAHSLFLCLIHHEITSGQIHNSKQKDVKNQHIQPDAWKFVHWLQRYDSTTIYQCITLLQLLHTWQH